MSIYGKFILTQEQRKPNPQVFELVEVMGDQAIIRYEDVRGEKKVELIPFKSLLDERLYMEVFDV